MLYAFHRRMPVDDAFISFRYAQNFASGHGLVWNPGERVEAYSNFLWVVMLAGGLKLGVQPLDFAVVMSFPLHLLGLILTFLLASRIIKDRFAALLVVVWVGTNRSFAGFATSGMETPLQYVLFTGTAILVVKSLQETWTRPRLLGLGLMLASALLTRPDSIILVASVLLVFYVSQRKSKSCLLVDGLFLLVPLIAITVPWLIWKVAYYGDIFPMAYHVKVRGLRDTGYGLFYVYLFVICHLLLPFVVLAAWRGKWMWKTDRILGYLAVFIIVWTAYIVYVGGDFMEFRFFIPILPFIGIVIIYVIRESISNRAVVAALAATLLLGNVNNLFALEKTVYGYGIESMNSLVSHIRGERGDWEGIGKKLGEYFGDTDVTIAVGAAGAIPYYSGLRSVDFLGLCDGEIYKISQPFGMVPGHRVVAPLEYIVNRGVNLFIEPNSFMMREMEFRRWLRTATWQEMFKFYVDVNRPVNGLPLNESVLLGIPIKPGYTLITWYMNPHPAVEAAIGEHGFKRLRLRRQ